MELILQSLSGDPLADEQVIRRLGCIPRLLAAQNAKCGAPLSAAELEDLTQETLLRVWSKRDEFAGRALLETWVFPFCHFAFMNRIRRKSRQPRFVDLEGAREVEARSQGSNFDHVHEALKGLPESDREAVWLKHFEGLTLAEIAERLDIQESTVRSRYYRGMARLHLRLQAPIGD